MMTRLLLPIILGLMASALPAAADETDVTERIKSVISAAGGEEKLLKLFRFRERVVLGDTPPPPVAENEPGNRTSVVEIPNHWWIGKEKRDKDKVRILVWAWTLRILIDPKTKVEIVEDTTVHGKPAIGLRVTESIKEPLDLFFDKDDLKLVCLDYADTRHVVSDWKKTADGFAYPARVVGYHFADRTKRTLQEKQWYQTDLLELTPLQELPPDLVR